MSVRADRAAVWLIATALVAACDGASSSARTSATDGSASAGGQTTGAAVATAIVAIDTVVASCRPCQFAIVSGRQPFAFTTDIDSMEASGMRMLAAVRVQRSDKPGWTQALVPQDAAITALSDSLNIGVVDLDFDGANDFFIVTSQGAANTYADYWRFRVAADSFEFAGHLPFIRVDSAQRTLSTYEQVGHAGRLYERRTFRFDGDSVTLLELESQRATSRDDVYLRTISRWDGRAMRVMSIDTVRTPP